MAAPGGVASRHAKDHRGCVGEFRTGESAEGVGFRFFAGWRTPRGVGVLGHGGGPPAGFGSRRGAAPERGGSAQECRGMVLLPAVSRAEDGVTPIQVGAGSPPPQQFLPASDVRGGDAPRPSEHDSAGRPSGVAGSLGRFFITWRFGQSIASTSRSRCEVGIFSAWGCRWGGRTPRASSPT